MTLAAFLIRLRETPGPWELQVGDFSWNERIRTVGTCRCPIMAIDDSGASWSFSTILAREDRNKVVASADGFVGSAFYDPDLRRQLLAATVERS